MTPPEAAARACEDAARALEDAGHYLADGRRVVPVRGKKPWDAAKGCVRDEWTTLSLTAADLEREFTGAITGCGLALGAPSGNLTDVDLDCPEAIAAADYLLPATGYEFGRPSARRSHREYITIDTAPRVVRYKDCDADKTTLLELRGTGGQTVFPRARHEESGEILAFDEEGAPAHVSSAVLRRAVERLAATTLLARHWPRHPGSRHDIALALAGYLLRGGLDAGVVQTIIGTAAHVAGDPEVSDRVAAVASTAAALAAGRPATGGPTLADLLTSAVVTKLTHWLGLGEGRPGSEDDGTGGEQAEHSADDPWPDPLPLDALDVPRFPVDALPQVLANKVRDVARVTQTPPDLAGTVGLATIAASGARRVDVAIGTTHVEPVNLYGACVAESGTRKGPAQRAMSAPLRTVEASLRAAAALNIERAKQRRKIAEKHVEHLSNRAAKASDPVEAQQLTEEAVRQASKLPYVPPLPTLIVGDRTPEKLEVDLAEQSSALLLEDEEAGTLFAIAGGRYSRDGSAQLDVYLKAYDRGALDTARITRDLVICATPELSISVTPQPFLMRQLRERPEFHHRGLLPRFLFSMPVSNVGYRPYDPKATYDATVAAAYTKMIGRLADLTRWPDRAELPHLRIEGAALLVWKRYADRIDRDCREGGRLDAIREWASKHPGRVARIAGTLHLVTLAATGRLTSTFPKDKALVDLAVLAARSILPRTVAASCRLGKYFEAHALAAYDVMGTLPDIDGARRVLAWIRRTKQTRFSARDAFTALDRNFFRSMDDDLIPCLGRLVEYGYLRWVPPPPRSGAGRPPSPVYEVNPKVPPPPKVRTPPPTPTPGNSADIAEDVGGLDEGPAGVVDPGNGTGDSADIAEVSVGFPEHPANARGNFADIAEVSVGVQATDTAPEKPGDAPQYTQNSGGDVRPPFEGARGLDGGGPLSGRPGEPPAVACPRCQRTDWMAVSGGWVCACSGGRPARAPLTADDRRRLDQAAATLTPDERRRLAQEAEDGDPLARQILGLPPIRNVGEEG
jgi:replicative DNA helicase